MAASTYSLTRRFDRFVFTNKLVYFLFFALYFTRFLIFFRMTFSSSVLFSFVASLFSSIKDQLSPFNIYPFSLLIFLSLFLILSIVFTSTTLFFLSLYSEFFTCFRFSQCYLSGDWIFLHFLSSWLILKFPFPFLQSFYLFLCLYVYILISFFFLLLLTHFIISSKFLFYQFDYFCYKYFHYLWLCYFLYFSTFFTFLRYIL